MIRGASPADCEAIAALNAELGYPATADAIRQRLEGVLAAPLQAVFAAEADGRARRFYERLGYTVTKTQNVFDRKW
ncbi:MAG TPA: hypothetical protein VM779_01455 [Thermoanaerobaculia bacterium]|nr:hypothetical protein [Thermoanaerobaculia bacterium]